VDSLVWPGDDVLAELGRITWAAMELEHLACSTCEAVIGTGDEVVRESAGRQLIAALEVLDTWPESEAKTAGERWLQRAQQALKRRHAVLHMTISSTTVHLDDERGITLDPDTLWMRYEPRHGDPHPVAPLTAEALIPTREALVEACENWASVGAELDYVRLLRWREGMVDRSSLAKAKRYVEPTIEEELNGRRKKY
jgi:hypothetical protein